MSRFTLEPSFWRPCGECLERAERGAGNPGRRRKKQCWNRQEEPSEKEWLRVRRRGRLEVKAGLDPGCWRKGAEEEFLVSVFVGQKGALVFCLRDQSFWVQARATCRREWTATTGGGE